MATNTTNYNLKKPAPDEFYNVADQNGNMDIIDEQLKQNADDIEENSTNLAMLQQEVTQHKDESATNAHLAKNIGLQDVDNLFSSTNVEEGMKELFTSVSNGKSLIGTTITDVDNKVIVPSNPTYQQLADSIRQMKTGIVEPVAGDVALIYQSVIPYIRSYSYVKAKEVRINFTGTIRVAFSMRINTNNQYALGIIRINNVDVGTLRRSGPTTAFTAFTEDFSVQEGDLLQLYARSELTIDYVYFEYFRIYVGNTILVESVS